LENDRGGAIRYHGELLGQIRASEDAQAESIALQAVKVHDDATLVSARIG
jgi:hypothetical protein